VSDDQSRTEEISLILAAEECPPERFDDIHAFSDHDHRVLRKLFAHGPVLLQGGRGSGKSALMIAASRQMMPLRPEADVLGLYVSLRYVPLLRASGDDYEKLFCDWVSEKIQRIVGDFHSFPETADVGELKSALTDLSVHLNKRIVLLFDDAAHIGREASLSAFFDIFRTLSSDLISCKAAIYPGVTEFGTRFDVYNDATLADIVRSPEQPGFADLFEQILRVRYPVLRPERLTEMSLKSVAEFLGAAVLGNVRGFIFACNYLLERAGDQSIGYNVVGSTLLQLAADYYWPLLEEVKPKLGRYVPAVEAAQGVAQELFTSCATSSAQSVVVHKKVVARYSKPFEILEYAGFVARREASRAMKSGGRGPRYAVNLCNLLESTSSARLTARLFEDWLRNAKAPVEVHERGSHFATIEPPVPSVTGDLGVFQLDIHQLAKSKAYPYGLTPAKIASLNEAGVTTVGELASLTSEQLLAIDGIGDATVERITFVLGQAIWM
jgi:hypothetical protein